MAKLVIVGSGLAAYMLAKAWRQQDADSELVMITAADGSYYSKPMLSTALTKGQAAQDLVMTDAAAMATTLAATIKTASRVTRICTETKRVWIEDDVIEYDQLVLALGAEPIHLPLEPTVPERVCSVNQLADYAAFRERLEGAHRIGVIGSGLVGCEFMNDLHNTEHELVMVSYDKTPLLQFLPPELGHAFQQRFTELGVTWHMGESVTGVTPDAEGVAVMTENGERFVVDTVLSAVGLRPSTDLARSAGLAIQRGVVVDAYCRTSAPDVYALGDCAEVAGHVLQYVAPLLQASRALAKTLSGQPTAVTYPPMPVVIKTPACPIAAIPPSAGVEGTWQIEGEGVDRMARFVDPKGVLQGFAVMGDQVSQRNALVKQMAPLSMEESTHS